MERVAEPPEASRAPDRRRGFAGPRRLMLAGAGAGAAAVRPRSYVLDLLRSGRVTNQAQVTQAGRRARFSAFERRTDAGGAAGLRPSERFRRR